MQKLIFFNQCYNYLFARSNQIGYEVFEVYTRTFSC